MKARLLFDLEDIDDRMAHIRCTRSLDAFLALSEILDRIAHRRNNGDEPITWEEMYIFASDIIREQYNIHPEEYTR